MVWVAEISVLKKVYVNVKDFFTGNWQTLSKYLCYNYRLYKTKVIVSTKLITDHISLSSMFNDGNHLPIYTTPCHILFEYTIWYLKKLLSLIKNKSYPQER